MSENPTVAAAPLDLSVEILPERQTLQAWGLGIFVAPVITVTPVIVVGNAIAVQAGTINSSVSAVLFQLVGVGIG